MHSFVESEFAAVQPVPPGTNVNYDSNNPLLRLIREIEGSRLAGSGECYLGDSVQYLYPVRDLALYGPGGDAWQVNDARQQDNKNDFQKQNIRDFTLGDFWIVRGYACAGDWIGPFVKLVYRASPGTELGRRTGGNPGPELKAFVKIGNTQSNPLVTLPLNPETRCYEAELWAYPGSNLRDLLGADNFTAFDNGWIQARPDLVKGSLTDFEGLAVGELRNELNRSFTPLKYFERAPEHAMHPIRILRLELAFGSSDQTQWDSQNGANYKLEFSMLFRGWKNALTAGVSPNPHGGVGFLEYRNLFSNYFTHEQERRAALGALWENELGRDLLPGCFDAETWNYGEPGGGPKVSSPGERERFFAVDYMDLHILQGDCGIGIHRHRDNQEVFFLIEGKGLMVVGDWCQFDKRERAFEIRKMLPGDLTICKTGQLHALFNLEDKPALLFMFGGYD